MSSKTIGRRMAGTVVVVAALIAATQGIAADYNATQSGYWDDPATWGGSGVPVTGDTAYVCWNSGNNLTVTVTNAAAAVSAPMGNGTTCALRINSGGSLTTGGDGAGVLYMGNGSTANTYLEINGGSLTCHEGAGGGLALVIGGGGYGSCTQYAGAVVCDGANGILQIGRGATTAIYTLAGGTVTAAYLQVNGTGDGVDVLNITGVTTTSCTTLELGGGTGTGIVIQSTGIVQAAETRIGKGNGGYLGFGLYRLDGGSITSTIMELGYWVGSKGMLEINGGKIDLGKGVIDGVGDRSMELGMGYYCSGIVTQRGGAVTMSGALQLGNQIGNSTGQYTICGGTLAPLSIFNGNGTAEGLFHVIGTNAVITATWYAQSSSSILRETFASGSGISPINLVDAGSDTTGSGTLTLDILGQVALWTTNDFALINTPYFDLGFTTTNRSVFAPLKAPSYPFNYHAPLDAVFQMAASPVPSGSVVSFNAANKGWVPLNTGSNAASPMVVSIMLQTNGATHTMSEIAAQVAKSGLTVTNQIVNGNPSLRFTLDKPAVATSYLGWDFSDYDANVLVGAVKFGFANGTIVSVR